MSEPLAAAEAAPAAAPAATGTPSDAPALEPTLLEGTPPAAEGEKAESAKPDTPAETPAEFKFDSVKLPEGFSVPDEAKAGFTALVNEHKIPTEAAQKLIDLYATQAKTAAESGVKVWQEMNKEWQTQIKTDLGDKFEPTLQSIAKLVNDPNLTDPGFKAAMNLTGAGNNPAVIKTLAKWAAAMTEGGHVGGAPPGTRARPSSLGEALYGSGEK